jgi:hypothetical protein
MTAVRCFDYLYSWTQKLGSIIGAESDKSPFEEIRARHIKAHLYLKAAVLSETDPTSATN